MEDFDTQSNSAGWMFFVKASFAIALIAVAVGIFYIEGDLLVKGYFSLCSLFLVSTTITLSKTLRDDHEAKRLINRVTEAKTTKMINEFTP